MNNTIAPLEGDTLLANQLELLIPTTASGTFYGIALALFCLYVRALAPRLQDDDRKRRARFMLVYSLVIMLCGLYALVSNTWLAQDAYIKHANHHGGPYSYEITTYHLPVIAITDVCQVAVDIMTLAIQIWRVWAIWNATGYANMVIILPSLCFLAFTALRLRTLVLGIALPVSKFVRLDAKTQAAEGAIQGATTILCTLLISLFLGVEQWRHRKLIGESQGSARYTKVVTILVESYALESIWLLMTATRLPVVIATFSETQAYIEIIAYLLVQYRVASGMAYESQRGQTHMSSMGVSQSNHAATLFGEANKPGSDSQVSVKAGTSDVLVIDHMA